MENEPEKGRRCEACFDKRFEVSANKALEIGEKKITTTLLVSPLKSQQQLKLSGDAFYEKNGVEFIAVDYRSGGGSQEQSQVTKQEQLYRQDYCGCIYGLRMQREQQNRLMDEMFSPISNQILPASIEERLQLYKKRIELENENTNYKIIRQKFLNYRQFSLNIVIKKDINLPAYALVYSTLPRKKAQGRVEFCIDDIHYFNRDDIKFITLEKFNKISTCSFKNIKELIFNPPTFEKELDIRKALGFFDYDLTPIIVLEEIPKEKISIKLISKVYEDTKENIIYY